MPKRLPPTNGQKWIDLVGAVVLLVIAGKLLLWVDRAVDITIADEARYLLQGVNLREVGFPSPQWAPLYSLWYFMLELLLPVQNNIDLYYLSFILLTLFVPILLYIYLRRASVLPVIALLVSILYMVSVSNLNIRPYPTKFAGLVVLLFLLVTTWVPRRWHYSMLLVLLLFLSYVRPEYAFATLFALAIGGVLALLKLRKEGSTALRSVAGQAILVAGLATLLVTVLGNPLAGGRNLTAFKQHVALTYTMNSDPNTNPWGNEDVIAEQLFGQFDSVPQAIQNNPLAFWQHVSTNIRVYPVNLLIVMLQPYLPPRILEPRTASTVFVLVVVAIMATLVLSVYSNLRYRQSLKSRTDLSRDVPFLAALHDSSNAKHLLLITALLVFITLPVIISSLLLHPRYHYLQVQGLLLLMLGSLFVSNTIRLHRPNHQFASLGAGAAMVGVGIVAVLMVPNLARGWSLFSEPRAWARTDYKNTVLAIQDLGVAPPVRFLAYGAAADYSFDVYLAPGLFRKVPPRLRSGDLGQFFAEYGINMIIWPDKILEDLGYRNDEQYATLLQDPASMGFREFVVPASRGQARIFVKEDLVAHWPKDTVADASSAGESAVSPPTSVTAQEAGRLMEQGEYAQAVALYTVLVTRDPNDRSSHMALGVALAQMGMEQQAIDRFGYVIKNWPQFPWALMRRAELLEKTGKTAAALKDYRAAIKIAPDNADIRFAVAYAFVRAGDIEAAIVEFETGLALDPTRDGARATLERLQRQ